jgi:hypothetical protein
MDGALQGAATVLDGLARPMWFPWPVGVSFLVAGALVLGAHVRMLLKLIARMKATPVAPDAVAPTSPETPEAIVIAEAARLRALASFRHAARYADWYDFWVYPALQMTLVGSGALGFVGTAILCHAPPWTLLVVYPMAIYVAALPWLLVRAVDKE